MPKGLARSLSRGNQIIQPVMKQIIRLNTTLSVTGATGVISAATRVIGDFPEGNVLFMGAVANLMFDATGQTAIQDVWNGDFSIGTEANADTDLVDAGEANIIPATASNAAAASKATAVIRAASTTALQGVIFDNTTGSLEMNLNFLVDANHVTNTQTAVVGVRGELYVLYSILGDD